MNDTFIIWFIIIGWCLLVGALFLVLVEMHRAKTQSKPKWHVGVVPNNFDWHDAIKYQLTTNGRDCLCPHCGSDLIEVPRDFELFEYGYDGQYMVTTYECPEGHGAYVNYV